MTQRFMFDHTDSVHVGLRELRVRWDNLVWSPSGVHVKCATIVPHSDGHASVIRSSKLLRWGKLTNLCM
jgi:hypothetical protein